MKHQLALLLGLVVFVLLCMGGGVESSAIELQDGNAGDYFLWACQGYPEKYQYAFCNYSLPLSKRLDDLVSRLTITDMLTQLMETQPPIPELDIPGFKYVIIFISFHFISILTF